MTNVPLVNPPQPSDDDPAVTATGVGDACCAVFSMTRRLPDGEDAAYLRWHMLDHLTEQYRIVGFRGGQRWVSTPDCRAARAVSTDPFDSVDHIVHYLFAEPVVPALDAFVDLGAALFAAAGRMPAASFGSGATLSLGRQIHIGVYDVVAKVASRNALVGASVIPWRPARGVYVLIEVVSIGGERAEVLADLAQEPGVAGMWGFRGSSHRWHSMSGDNREFAVSVFYLDEDPVAVAGSLGMALPQRWADGSIVPLLAAPFEIVVPWEWDRALP